MLRPNVLKMQPYPPGKPIEEVQRELGLTDVVKLASNENPLGPSPLAVEAIREAAAKLNLYPDARAFDLVKAIGSRFDIPTDNVLVGNGSDELIHLLGLVLIDSPNDEVIVGDPSFVRYDAAAYLAPCKLIKVPLDPQERHDLRAIQNAITKDTAIVFIANPNNPTGTIVGRDDLDAFVRDMPPHVTLVLDEAYVEFAQHDPNFKSSLEFVREDKRVVGLRTFSKAYGLAGIRLGFAIADDALVDAIHRAREPFNTNYLAQVAGIAALQDEAHLARTLENNARNRLRIEEALRRVGGVPVPSFTNFVFADMGQPAEPIFRKLLEQGVIIRSGHVLGRPTALRVSVGTDAETDRFIAALETAMREPATR